MDFGRGAAGGSAASLRPAGRVSQLGCEPTRRQRKTPAEAGVFRDAHRTPEALPTATVAVLVWLAPVLSTTVNLTVYVPAAL